jgi:hypothetical protein
MLTATSGGRNVGLPSRNTREIQNPNHIKFTLHMKLFISNKENKTCSRFTYKCIFMLSRNLFIIFHVFTLIEMALHVFTYKSIQALTSVLLQLVKLQTKIVTW